MPWTSEFKPEQSKMLRDMLTDPCGRPVETDPVLERDKAMGIHQ